MIITKSVAIYLNSTLQSTCKKCELWSFTKVNLHIHHKFDKKRDSTEISSFKNSIAVDN